MMLLTQQLVQKLSQITLTTTLAMGGISLGIIPEISPDFSRVNWNFQVVAQTITNEEINKYAQAVLSIENLRKQAFINIRKIMGTNSINEISCYEVESLNSLNTQARNIAQNFCQSSQTIVQNTGLTPEKFNQITQVANTNSDLQKRIHNAMIQLRSK